jgi:hypothetical protein
MNVVGLYRNLVGVLTTLMTNKQHSQPSLVGDFLLFFCGRYTVIVFPFRNRTPVTEH